MQLAASSLHVVYVHARAPASVSCVYVCARVCAQHTCANPCSAFSSSRVVCIYARTHVCVLCVSA